MLLNEIAVSIVLTHPPADCQLYALRFVRTLIHEQIAIGAKISPVGKAFPNSPAMSNLARIIYQVGLIASSRCKQDVSVIGMMLIKGYACMLDQNGLNHLKGLVLSRG